MRRNILILIVLMLVVTGCANKIQKSKNVVKLSEDETLEYNYAFTEATKQFVFGNLKQALVLYQKCIEVNPESAASYYQLSVIFTNIGETKRAIRYAKKATAINEEEIWYKLNLANLYKAEGHIDSATMVFENVVTRNKGNLEYWFTLANLYAENGEFKKALEMLNEIESTYGVSEQTSITKHKIYAQLGKKEMAVKTIKGLINLEPGNVMYHGILAEYYSEVGEDEKAEKIYSKILELDGNNAYVYLSTGEHFSKKGEYYKAFEYYKKGLKSDYIDVDEKVKTLIGIITNERLLKNRNEEISELINTMVEKNPDNVRVLTLRADFYVRSDEMELAEKDLEKVIDSEKKNFVIWEQLLYIKNTLGKYNTLLEYAEGASKHFPDKPSVFLFKGLAEMQLNNNEDAVETFRTGLAKSGDNKRLKIQFYTFLGDSYRNLNENAKSDKAFEKVLEMDPDNLIVLNNYSYYLSLRKERLEQAKEYSKRTVKEEPENPTYLDTYAWILYNMNMYEEALKYIKKAYDNGGNETAEILEHYGDILNALGRTEEAITFWRAAAKLDEDNNGLVEKIKENE